MEKELEKCKLQCEDLRTKLKEKSKETVELQVKSKEREAALSKCQRDFLKIEKQINEFLQIKEEREKEEEAVDRADERDMIPTEFSKELLQQDSEINLKSFSKSFQSLKCGGKYTQM